MQDEQKGVLLTRLVWQLIERSDIKPDFRKFVFDYVNMPVSLWNMPVLTAAAHIRQLIERFVRLQAEWQLDPVSGYVDTCMSAKLLETMVNTPTAAELLWAMTPANNAGKTDGVYNHAIIIILGDVLPYVDEKDMSTVCGLTAMAVREQLGALLSNDADVAAANTLVDVLRDAFALRNRTHVALSNAVVDGTPVKVCVPTMLADKCTESDDQPEMSEFLQRMTTPSLN